MECLEYSQQNVFIALPKEKIRRLALSTDLSRWRVPVGHLHFCRDTNLNKHKLNAVLFLSIVQRNVMKKSFKLQDFSLAVTLSCLPLPVQIFFCFFACCNFWPFFAYIYFWLESWGIIHLISLCYLNFLMLLEFNISSNTVMKCYSVIEMTFPKCKSGIQILLHCFKIPTH